MDIPILARRAHPSPQATTDVDGKFYVVNARMQSLRRQNSLGGEQTFARMVYRLPKYHRFTRYGTFGNFQISRKKL